MSTTRHNYDWSKITLADNYMFITVFSQPDLCRELLEILLGIPIKEMRSITGEKAIAPGLGARGVRMDVYVDYPEGHVFDVEMQCENEGNYERRSRYYLSSIDYDCIRNGEDYEQLRESYVIFICKFDPFKHGLVRYTITPHCHENGIEMADGATRMFVNAPGFASCDDPRLRCFLQYLMGGTIEDDFTERVDRVVRKERDSTEWRRNRMSYEIRLREERAKGRAEAFDAMSELAARLDAAGRLDELADALRSEELRARLFTEFGIGDAGSEQPSHSHIEDTPLCAN